MQKLNFCCKRVQWSKLSQGREPGNRVSCVGTLYVNYNIHVYAGENVMNTHIHVHTHITYTRIHTSEEDGEGEVESEGEDDVGLDYLNKDLYSVRRL